MNPELQSRPLYPERPGANIAPQIEAFRRPPEIALSESERSTVLGVEAVLTRGSDLNTDLYSLTSDKVLGIEHIYDKKVNTTDFYIDYFLTDAGKLDAQKLGIFQDEVDSAASSREAWRELLLKADYTKISSAEVGSIERRSKESVIDSIVESFSQNDFTTIDHAIDPLKLTVVRNPEVLAQKLEELTSLRRYLKKYAKHLGQGEVGNIERGNQVMARIHRRRVNELISGLFPDAQAFLEQATVSQNDSDRQIAERIKKVLPSVTSFTEGKAQKNFARIDKFRNGVGQLVDGDYNQLSDEAKELADRVSVIEKVVAPAEYRYKGQEDVWKNINVSPEEFREWGELFLEARGIKSAYSDYDPDSKDPAQDGLWRAVFDPKATSLSVDSHTKVMKFPPRKNEQDQGRKIAQISPAGAAPGISHEGRHVDQHINKAALGLAITEIVGMDRSSLMGEAGGIAAEVATQLEDFGQIRPINPEYFRAAQVKISGGSYKDCVKAFFDSQLARNPNADKRKIAEQAADRVLRLFRSGGQTADNSPYFTHSGGGTFEYLEQELLAQEIRGTELEPLFYLTGVNIEMLAELHKIGMFNINNIITPPNASVVLRDRIDAKIFA